MLMKPQAKEMTSLLMEAKKSRQELISNGILVFDNTSISKINQKYSEIISNAYLENLEWLNKRYKNKAMNLYKRFEKHKDKILRFIYDFNIPFDNNLAERELRMSKLRMKISGCFRSFSSLQYFCRIRNYISNSRKNGNLVFASIQNLFNTLVIG